MRKDHPTGSKGRILFLQQYLLDHTDENHPASTGELIALCEAEGFKVNRVTLHDDIKTIEAMGTDVIVARGQHQDSFFVGQRTFELAELKLLVDAIASSDVISARQRARMVRKLKSLAPKNSRRLLSPARSAEHGSQNESSLLLINTDVLCSAIDAGKQVSFTYFDYDQHKNRVHRHNGEAYILSPRALVWSNDRYYVAGHTAEHEGITTFRVDRIDQVTVLDEDACIEPSFNLDSSLSPMIKMYSGEVMQVQLLCDNKCMRNVIDRFGENVYTEIVDDDHFTATVTVAVGPTFYGWLIQYAGSIRIAGPQDARESFERFLADCLDRQKTI